MKKTAHCNSERSRYAPHFARKKRADAVRAERKKDTKYRNFQSLEKE